MSILDRFKEPSSWAGVGAGAGLALIALTVPMSPIVQTGVLVCALVALALGFGLVEKARDRF